MTSRGPLLAIAGLIIGGLAAVLLLAPSSTTLPQGSVETGKALVGGPFTLTDQTGKRVTDKDFRGKYMLVFFGFTHCPDICPSALQVISAALGKLGDKAKDVVPIFITLDPQRDTPQKLGEYLSSFDTKFVGLTGSKEEVESAAKAYRVYYQVVPDDKTPGEYTIDHAAIIYLMGKDGEFVTHVPHTNDVDQVVSTLDKAL
ncbi:MAG: SCO family protein [Hyphomicrobiaceae bacterium]|nr:SCO family protein [Hyphomicrobiaceae bacterium]